MTASPLVSVVVPNYNNSAFLSVCLDSILGQSHAELEVLVSDDASTDASAEIIRAHAEQDPRLRPIFQKRNLGVAANRDSAIRAARGDYVTTLDSDDLYLDRNKIAREVELLRGAPAGATIAFSCIVLMDSQGVPLAKQPRPDLREGIILEEILQRSCMIPRDFLFTHGQYLAAGGLDAAIPMYEDWDLKIRLARDNAFFCTGCAGIGYRRHGRGLSAVAVAEHVRWLCHVFDKNVHLAGPERQRVCRLAFADFLRKTHKHRPRSGGLLGWLSRWRGRYP